MIVFTIYIYKGIVELSYKLGVWWLMVYKHIFSNYNGRLLSHLYWNTVNSISMQLPTNTTVKYILEKPFVYHVLHKQTLVLLLSSWDGIIFMLETQMPPPLYLIITWKSTLVLIHLLNNFHVDLVCIYIFGHLKKTYAMTSLTLAFTVLFCLIWGNVIFSHFKKYGQ